MAVQIPEAVTEALRAEVRAYLATRPDLGPADLAQYTTLAETTVRSWLRGDIPGGFEVQGEMRRMLQQARAGDILATAGNEGRAVVLTEDPANLDILISFQMPHMELTDDLAAWAAFEAFALPGGQFSFYPCTTLADNYNCVAEDERWEPQRNAPQKYGATVVIRCLNAGTAPSDPGVVLRRFYGIST